MRYGANYSVDGDKRENRYHGTHHHCHKPCDKHDESGKQLLEEAFALYRGFQNVKDGYCNGQSWDNGIPVVLKMKFAAINRNTQKD